MRGREGGCLLSISIALALANLSSLFPFCPPSLKTSIPKISLPSLRRPSHNTPTPTPPPPPPPQVHQHPYPFRFFFHGFFLFDFQMMLSISSSGGSLSMRAPPLSLKGFLGQNYVFFFLFFLFFRFMALWGFFYLPFSFFWGVG